MLRYDKTEAVTSNHDPMDVMLDWMGFLTSTEYLIDLLRGTHGVIAADARARAKKIIPHVAIASEYMEQAMRGPQKLAYLPAYYAILNLLKVYILLGPHHGDLARNRWHGATYDPHGKDSHSVLTERITLKSGGVIPLFYRAITGQSLPAQNNHLQVGAFLGLLLGVSAEYRLATGLTLHHALELAQEPIVGTGDVRPIVRFRANMPPAAGVIAPIPAGNLKFLNGFRARAGVNNVYAGKACLPANVDSQYRRFMLYRVHHQLTFTVAAPGRIMFFEELPIVLLFFYMSSVVRYRPEFFEKMQQSKYWPIVSSARKHAFHSFCMAFWSYCHQTNYFLLGQQQ